MRGLALFKKGGFNIAGETDGGGDPGGGGGGSTPSIDVSKCLELQYEISQSFNSQQTVDLDINAVGYDLATCHVTESDGWGGYNTFPIDGYYSDGSGSFKYYTFSNDTKLHIESNRGTRQTTLHFKFYKLKGE